MRKWRDVGEVLHIAMMCLRTLGMVDDSDIKPTPSEQGTKGKRGSKLVVTTQHDKPTSSM